MFYDVTGRIQSDVINVDDIEIVLFIFYKIGHVTPEYSNSLQDGASQQNHITSLQCVNCVDCILLAQLLIYLHHHPDKSLIERVIKFYQVT